MDLPFRRRSTYLPTLNWQPRFTTPGILDQIVVLDDQHVSASIAVDGDRSIFFWQAWSHRYAARERGYLTLEGTTKRYSDALREAEAAIKTILQRRDAA